MLYIHYTIMLLQKASEFTYNLNKSLGVIYEEAQKKRQQLPKIELHQADSLIEKCSTAIHEIHGPIYKTKTANRAEITATIGATKFPLQSAFTLESWDYIHETHQSESPEQLVGHVSSYNSNTYKGRIYVEKFGRPISELVGNTRNQKEIKFITSSLQANALGNSSAAEAKVYILAYLQTSRLGTLKSFSIIHVSNKPINLEEWPSKIILKIVS